MFSDVSLGGLRPTLGPPQIPRIPSGILLPSLGDSCWDLFDSLNQNNNL